MPDMQVPDGLMTILTWFVVIYAVQVAVSLVYLVLEIVRDGRDHAEADQDVQTVHGSQTVRDEDGNEWEVRA